MLSAVELADFQERVSAVVKDSGLGAFGGPDEQQGSRFYFGVQGEGFFTEIDRLWLIQPDDEQFLAALSDNKKLPESLYWYCAYLPLVIQGELEPWKPDHFVVEFRPSIEDRVTRPHWPDVWPSPESGKAKSYGDRRFVVLDVSYEVKLQQLLGAGRDDIFMEIEAGGKNYGVGYRYYFPGGESWYVQYAYPDLNSCFMPRWEYPRPPVVPKPVPPKNAFELK
jgi:hypothetical protein